MVQKGPLFGVLERLGNSSGEALRECTEHCIAEHANALVRSFGACTNAEHVHPPAESYPLAVREWSKHPLFGPPRSTV